MPVEKDIKMPNTDLKFESGLWTGEYLDVKGYRGTLSIEFNMSGQSLKGKFEMKLKSEDKPQFLAGEVEGSVERDNIKIKLISRKEKMPDILYNAKLSEAGSFAKQSMYGIIETAGGFNFGGGVFIAWRFSSQERK